MNAGDQFTTAEHTNGEAPPPPFDEAAVLRSRVADLSAALLAERARTADFPAGPPAPAASGDPSKVVAAITESFATLMRRFHITKFRYVNEAANGTETWEFEMLPSTHEERIRRTLADPMQREIPHANLTTPEDEATKEQREAAAAAEEEALMYGHLGGGGEPA